MQSVRSRLPSIIVTFFTKRTSRLLPLVALLTIAGIWLTTMPTSLVVANDPLPDPTGAFPGILQLMDDSGEFLIAWHTWGVTHAPGYPLLSLVANVGVRLLDPLKLYPVTTANLLSFLFALGAFVLLAACRRSEFLRT